MCATVNGAGVNRCITCSAEPPRPSVPVVAPVSTPTGGPVPNALANRSPNMPGPASGPDFDVDQGTASVVCSGIQTANATVYLIDSVLAPTA